MEAYNYFAALAEDVDRVAPRPASAQGGHPPCPTQTVVRILVLERLYNLPDEEMVHVQKAGIEAF